MSRPAPLCRLSLRCAMLGLGAVLLAVGLAPVLSGCGSSAPAVSSAPTPVRTAEAGTAAPAAYVASALRSETRRWEGTPYRLGGTTRRGVDCSGFVQRLFAGVLDVSLPRSTRTQVREGRRISRSALRPGDLVFFHPGSKGRHVGVYVGDGEFAHASSSAGPTISPLARAYWQDSYWTARRVLRLAPPAAPPADSSVGASLQTNAAPPAERTGW